MGRFLNMVSLVGVVGALAAAVALTAGHSIYG